MMVLPQVKICELYRNIFSGSGVIILVIVGFLGKWYFFHGMVVTVWVSSVTLTPGSRKPFLSPRVWLSHMAEDSYKTSLETKEAEKLQSEISFIKRVLSKMEFFPPHRLLSCLLSLSLSFRGTGSWTLKLALARQVLINLGPSPS